MTPKIYLSGPMTGIKYKNFPAFIKAAKELRKKGYFVVSPHELEVKYVRLTWEDCMRRDIKAELNCQAIATLPRFKNSRGASIEVYIAKKLGMPVHPIEYWLQDIKKRELK